MYTHRYVHKHIRTHVHTYIHTHTQTHTYIHTYMHTYIHTYIYTHTCIHTYIHLYTYIHTHTDTYIHTFTHIHTYAHTCTQLLQRFTRPVLILNGKLCYVRYSYNVHNYHKVTQMFQNMEILADKCSPMRHSDTQVQKLILPKFSPPTENLLFVCNNHRQSHGCISNSSYVTNL